MGLQFVTISGYRLTRSLKERGSEEQKVDVGDQQLGERGGGTGAQGVQSFTHAALKKF